MKKIIILLMFPIIALGQYTPQDSVYDVSGDIRYWEFGDSAIEIKYKTDAMINEINDSLPEKDSILQSQINDLPDRNELGDTATAVETRSNSYTDSQVIQYDTVLLANNDTTYVNIIDTSVYKDAIIDYIISRDTSKEQGQYRIFCTSTTPYLIRAFYHDNTISGIGVDYNVDINGGYVRIMLILDDGDIGSLRYAIKR